MLMGNGWFMKHKILLFLYSVALCISISNCITTTCSVQFVLWVVLSIGNLLGIMSVFYEKYL